MAPHESHGGRTAGILHTDHQALTGIACLLPTDIHTLMTIPQIGRVKAEKYGEEIVNMVWKYRETIFSKDQGL